MKTISHSTVWYYWVVAGSTVPHPGSFFGLMGYLRPLLAKVQGQFHNANSYQTKSYSLTGVFVPSHGFQALQVLGIWCFPALLKQLAFMPFSDEIHIFLSSLLRPFFFFFAYPLKNWEWQWTWSLFWGTVVIFPKDPGLLCWMPMEEKPHESSCWHLITSLLKPFS